MSSEERMTALIVKMARKHRNSDPHMPFFPCLDDYQEARVIFETMRGEKGQ